MAAVRDRVRTHREKLREQGFRPVTIWLPDSRDPEFAAEAARQSKLAAEADRYDDTQDCIDTLVSDMWDEV